MNPVHPKRRLLLNRHPRRPGPATERRAEYRR